MKRIVTAFGVAALAMAMVLPSVQAADHSTNTTSTLFASSLNCQYREQPDCVDDVTSLTQDAAGAGEFCVGVADFHEAAAPFANGCVALTSAQLFINDSQALVPTVDVPAVYTGDCFNTIPEDNCVQRTLVLHASASFTATGSSRTDTSMSREVAGTCVITEQVKSTRVNLVGSVVVDGFVYDLSGTDPTLHHFEASLLREDVTSTTRCVRGRGLLQSGKELLLDEAAAR